MTRTSNPGGKVLLDSTAHRKLRMGPLSDCSIAFIRRYAFVAASVEGSKAGR